MPDRDRDRRLVALCRSAGGQEAGSGGDSFPPPVPSVGALLPWPATSAAACPLPTPSVRAAPAPPSSPHPLLCLESPPWGHAPRTLPLLCFPVALSLELGATSLQDTGRGWDDSASSPGRQVGGCSCFTTGMDLIRDEGTAELIGRSRPVLESLGLGGGTTQHQRPSSRPAVQPLVQQTRLAFLPCRWAAGPRATVQDALALALGASSAQS